VCARARTGTPYDVKTFETAALLKRRQHAPTLGRVTASLPIGFLFLLAGSIPRLAHLRPILVGETSLVGSGQATVGTLVGTAARFRPSSGVRPHGADYILLPSFRGRRTARMRRADTDS
jgi:hypothetical protein